MSESRNYRICLLAKLAEGDAERLRLEALARAFAGDDLFARAFKARAEASRLAHWVRSHTGVELIACEAVGPLLVAE